MKKNEFVPFSVKGGILPFIFISFISLYACENIDDAMQVDDIVTTRSYGQYTDAEWKIVKLMPTIENIKWEEPACNEEPPSLIMEVKPAPGSLNDYRNTNIEVGVSNSFDLDDPLLEYTPCFQRELYSYELNYPDQTIILTIPATELGEGNYIAVRSIFTKEGEYYYGAAKTNEVKSLWNPYATMVEFDKRFPRPAYNDNLPMHIWLVVQFSSSNIKQDCEFYIGINSTPVASVSCETSDKVTTKYVSIDCDCKQDNVVLAYKTLTSPVTVFYTVPYKVNIFSLLFSVPTIHL